MTGLDRLRGYARRMDELHVWPGGARLLDIADQIERERNVCDREEHEAASWVREHGGLDAVRSEWSSRVPYDKHEQRRQRLLGHIAECEMALRRRNARIEGLGHRISELARENAELRRRAMPEGMKWPRFEDGELVRVGDEFMGKDGKTYTVQQVQFIGKCFSLYDFCDRKAQFNAFYGELVKRPAPKVLDADGVEIRVGDTVYDVEDGCELVVTKVTSDAVFVAFEDVEADKYDASQLTHRAPVLAADGMPLRVGEHVWHVETGTELVVKELPKPGAYQAVVVFAPPASHLTSFDPDQLTHERPESKCRDCAHWQKDPTADNMGVCWFFYHEHEGQDCYPARLGDIGACEEFMPRASALTERERGE